MRRDFVWPETKAQLADLLESIMGRQPFEKRYAWDVDELEYQPFSDPDMEAWRQRILREIWHLQFPSKGEYQDKIAQDRVSKIVASLRQNENASNQ